MTPQCGNIKIFISFRFYVKSILVDSRSAKAAIFAILGAVNFVNLVNIGLQKVQKFIQIKSSAPKCVKMANFALQESPKLISRKICLIEKL